MSEVIDDLVVLGRAAPEPIKDGRHTVCLGGYSESKGFVRLYPTRMRMDALRKWNVVEVEVINDPDDPRDESYKFVGSKSEWESLEGHVTKVGRLDKSERIQLADRLAGDCAKVLNEEKKSLGIVKPAEFHDFYVDDQGSTTFQVDLQQEPIKGKNDYPYKLYFTYTCEGCRQQSPHDQHIIEWGVYQYWEKHDDEEGVIDALHLREDDWEHYLFIGNLRHRRTAFVVICTLRFKHEDMLQAGVRPDGVPGLGQFSE